MPVCPICKEEFEQKKAKGMSTLMERAYFFDTYACKKTFDEEPAELIEKIIETTGS